MVHVSVSGECCLDRAQPKAAQRGFSLIEISIVTTIVMLIAIVGIPSIQSYVVESKVPRVAEELQRFVARMKATTQGFGVAPYAGIDTGVLANALRTSSVVLVSGVGSGARVLHGLGGSSSGKGGVHLEPYAMPGGQSGTAFALTLRDVNQAACPGLAAILQRIAEYVTITGINGPVVVKNAMMDPVMSYNPLLADAQCAAGDNNVFTFVVR